MWHVRGRPSKKMQKKKKTKLQPHPAPQDGPHTSYKWSYSPHKNGRQEFQYWFTKSQPSTLEHRQELFPSVGDNLPHPLVLDPPGVLPPSGSITLQLLAPDPNLLWAGWVGNKLQTGAVVVLGTWAKSGHIPPPPIVQTSLMSGESSFTQTRVSVLIYQIPALHPWASARAFSECWWQSATSFGVGSTWCIATQWFHHTSTACARSQPPLTLSRSFSKVLHFLHSLGPFTLNFVNSTLTLWRAKCQPQAVDHSSKGMFQLALDTQCLTRPCLFLEMAHSFCFSLGGFNPTSLQGSLFFLSSVRITLTIFTSSSCCSDFSLFPSWIPGVDWLSPCCLTFTGNCSRASVIYLMTAEDFHLPKNAMSNKGKPCLAYIIAPDLLPECPVAFASRNFCQSNTNWILDRHLPSFLGNRLASGSVGASS